MAIIEKGTYLELVLLVEDEVAIVKLAAEMLEDLGYRVISARSPKEALTLAEGYREQIK